MLEKIDPKKLSANPFELIGDEWMLVTAGTPESFNTMTASWGGVGILWGNPVATAYIRPQRYTRAFIEREELFTLSFYDKSCRPALQFCGSHSGREVDKVKETGLTPLPLAGSVTFSQAKLTLVCRKQYVQKMRPDCFTDTAALEKWYPEKDYHYMYIAQIVAAYANNG